MPSRPISWSRTGSHDFKAPPILPAAQADAQGAAGFTKPDDSRFSTTSRWTSRRSTRPRSTFLMDVGARAVRIHLGFPGSRPMIGIQSLGRCWCRQASTGKPIASDPIPFVAAEERPIGLVSRVPDSEGRQPPEGPQASSRFSYELASLMLTNDDRSLFSVVLKNPDDANDEYVCQRSGRHHLARAAGRPDDPSPVGGADGNLRRPRTGLSRLLCQEQRPYSGRSRRRSSWPRSAWR